MPSAFSPNLNLELQANGEHTDTWGIVLNNGVFTILDNVLGGVLPLSLASANVTLTTTQTQNNTIVLTGILTANVQIIFPQIGRNYLVVNNTTGAFSVTLKTTLGGGAVYVIPQGQKRYITLANGDVLVGQSGIGSQISIASAATTDIGTLSSQNALVTGTTPITSFGSNANTATPIYQVTFAGSLTITYNATSMITPGAGNIYTQAGDSMIVAYLGSGNWQVLSYSANAFIPGTQPIAGGFRNLVIAGTGNATATLTADALTLEDSIGRAYRARTVSLALNLGTSGANGLDTGAETANTWYSLWAIYNQTTNTMACLASISATAPTLPAGYTFKARFGWLRNDASANLWRTLQYGNSVQIKVGANPTAAPIIASGNAGNPSTPTWVAIAVGSFAPPTACKVSVVPVGLANIDGATYMIAGNNSYGAWSNTINPPPFSWGWGQRWGVGIFPPVTIILESTNIYWASSNSSGLGIVANGWEDNL